MRKLHHDILREEKKTRRHIDVVFAGLRADLRRWIALAIRSHSERLNNHEVRLLRLEGTP